MSSAGSKGGGSSGSWVVASGAVAAGVALVGGVYAWWKYSGATKKPTATQETTTTTALPVATVVKKPITGSAATTSSASAVGDSKQSFSGESISGERTSSPPPRQSVALANALAGAALSAHRDRSRSGSGEGLQNRYYVVRHGESDANVSGIISSDPAIAVINHGLTPLGRTQAITAAAKLTELLPAAAGGKSQPQRVVIFTSDFKRASETARIIRDQLSVSGGDVRLVVDTQLRERSFGAFEGESNKNYDRVWESDAKYGCTNTANDVESPDSVMCRVLALIDHCESSAFDDSKSPAAADIVFVSHGDTLQILSSTFVKSLSGPHQHRSVPHLTNCEVRALRFVDSVDHIKTAPAAASAAAAAVGPTSFVADSKSALPVTIRTYTALSRLCFVCYRFTHFPVVLRPFMCYR